MKECLVEALDAGGAAGEEHLPLLGHDDLQGL